jgi:serine/threonine-protein kinase
MNDLSGQSLGRYHLIEKLGEGGMAIVYRAYDTRLECDVAVKIIRLDELPRSSEGRALKRFEREAKAVAQLTHINIVKVSDYGEENGIPYLVMPYLSGGTLKQMLGKPIVYTEAARLLAPVASALQYAHEHNIVHRDVKPSNILITESGAPMLTDFGIARILEQKEGQTLTGTGVGIGTPEYMAPEQWTGNITPAVDIYSLGVVFYELVTGHKPYTADTPAAVLLKQATEPLPRPSTFNPDLPEKVEQIIYKAMAKKAEDRYPTMLEFENALEGLRALSNSSPFIAKRSLPEKAKPDVAATFDPLGIQLESRPAPKEKPASEPEIDVDQPFRQQKQKVGGRQTNWVWLVLLGLGFLFFVFGRGTNWFTRWPTLIISPTATQTTSVVTEDPTQTNYPTVTTTATPEFDIGSILVSPIDGMEMVFIPAGNFIMGSPDDVGEVWEHPQHTVYLDAYWIDKTEVTNAKYAKCVEAGACTEPDNFSSSTRDSYYDNSSYADYPVIYVTWFQARDYCIWAKRALPTEAQWEKAAHGLGGSTFPWGESSPNSSIANFNHLFNDTTSVGKFPDGASPYGALDMAGNVWEWVADWRSDYPSGYVVNPTGDATGNIKVVRGGSWVDPVNYMRSASKSWDSIDTASNGEGFRCAKNTN